MYRQKTLYQIVLETVNFYSRNPELRSILNTGTCLYTPTENQVPGSPGCAVGRVIDLNVCKLSEGRSAQTCYNRLLPGNPYYNPHRDNKEGYKTGSKKFWEELQWFHDNPNNWKAIPNSDNTAWTYSISKAGKEQADVLLARYYND